MSAGAKAAEAVRGGALSPETVAGVRAGTMPSKPRPQLATLAEAIPRRGEWIYEIKWDGYRLLARKAAGKVSLLTRRGHDWTDKFSGIAEALKDLPGNEWLLDGEAVALDPNGRSNFQSLQNSIGNPHGPPLHFMVFDLIYFDGHDFQRARQIDRKAFLEKLLSGRAKGSPVHFCEHISGKPQKILDEACALELEGLIAKRIDAPYSPARSKDWLKLKCLQREEFVIIGYTEPSGSRHHFGALLLATRPETGGTLAYAGRVGTGFNEQSLAQIHEAMRTRRRPDPPELGGNLPARVRREAIWIEPELVAEVAYQEMTSEGVLRHPSFKGLRHDKPAKTVKKEKARTPETDEPTAYRGVEISNPDRVIAPDVGLTKGDLARYYSEIAERMMPYIENRPLSMLRCPSGRHKNCFFQKHFRDSVPEFVETIDIREKEGKAPYPVIRDAAGIVSLAQMGVIEFHPWGSRADNIEKPDRIIFDLDPGDGVDWQEIVGAAHLLRDMLGDVDLESFPKLTGGKGVHVVVPVTRRNDWETTKQFARAVSEALADRNRKKFLTKATKKDRKGRIFVDYLRNGRGATAVASFSVRARSGLPIAVPITWNTLAKLDRPSPWNIAEPPKASQVRKPEALEEVRQSLSKSRLQHFGVASA